MQLMRRLALVVFVMSPIVVVAQARQVGTVKQVDGTNLTLTTTAGSATVAVAADAAVLQMPPCATNLKLGTPSTLAAIAAGDRVITGKAGDTATASRVILMKASDSAACKASQQADWRQNGTGGLVKAVDGPVMTVSAGAKTLKVTTTPTTVFRRYADDSVSFEDAKAGKLEQIAAGDQLSVRGKKSDDGTEIAAEEVVTGTFENLSGPISAVDLTAGTITLKDLISKKTLTVKVTDKSDLRKLPAQAAAAFATRSTGGGAGAGAGRPAGAGGGSGEGRPAGAGGPGGPGSGGGGRSAGMDLSRMLARLPAQKLTDLKVGDAVMVVASQENTGTVPLTAITLLSGVEQLLSASPSGSAPITLSPWDLGAPGGGGGGGR